MRDLWDSSSSEDELQKPQLESKDHQIALSDEEWESVDDSEYLKDIQCRQPVPILHPARLFDAHPG